MNCSSARVRASTQAILVLGLAVTGAAMAQEQAGKPAPLDTPASPAYTIGAGDILRIIVWKEPDLTLDVTVRFDGIITVPLLGDLQAAGRAHSQLAESLGKGLARFVEAPRVTVSVSQANSARFYVMGQVTKPGEFP